MPGAPHTGSLTGMSRISTSLTHTSSPLPNTSGASLYALEQAEGAVNSVAITSSLIDTSTIYLSRTEPTVTFSSPSYTAGGD